MNKIITLNTVKVTDSMLLYALDGSTLYVMLEYLNPLGPSGQLLAVTDTNYADLLTTTNLGGSPVFSFSAGAEAQGTEQLIQMPFSHPLKSSAQNTATTIVCPATTGVIWRVIVSYYICA